MFRSRILSVLQNTINRNLYNNGNARICALFSSNTTNTNTTETSTNTLDNNVSGASTEILTEALKETSNQNSTDSSTETLKETSNQNSTDSSTETLKETDFVNTNSVETPSTETSTSENCEPDKLYKKLEIEIKGNEPAVLGSYITFSVMAAKYLGITVGTVSKQNKPIHERLTVLKSVHVHKKHRVQYETRTYYRYWELFHLTGSTVDTYLEYIQRNLPEGVAMKATKVELQPLPESVRQASLSK